MMTIKSRNESSYKQKHYNYVVGLENASRGCGHKSFKNIYILRKATKVSGVSFTVFDIRKATLEFFNNLWWSNSRNK